jgi:hypothetical protein
MNPVLAEALQSTRATEFVESGSDLYLARRIAPENSAALAQSDPHRLVRLALILEDQGIRGFVDSVNSGVSSNGHQPNSPATEGGEPYSDFRSTLHQAFVCWRALVNLGG